MVRLNIHMAGASSVFPNLADTQPCVQIMSGVINKYLHPGRRVLLSALVVELDMRNELLVSSPLAGWVPLSSWPPTDSLTHSLRRPPLFSSLLVAIAIWVSAVSSITRLHFLFICKNSQVKRWTRICSLFTLLTHAAENDQVLLEKPASEY